MSLKKRLPVTPSLRHTITISYKDLLGTILPENFMKSSIKGKRKKSGHNNQGRITVRRRGGGHKQNYRTINFKRSSLQGKFSVYSIEYDPNRSSFISAIGPHFNKKLLKQDSKTIENFVKSLDKKEFSYILTPKNVSVGDTIYNYTKQTDSTEELNFSSGNTMPLRHMPLGSLLHNIELKKGFGGQIARSAGTYAQLIQKKIDPITNKGKARVRLPSGEQRWIPIDCLGTIGSLSNESYNLTKKGKAGRSRWLGKRPKVRGVAMNPVDHPHGGGEGKTSGGRPSVTPWGRPTKGYITRSTRKKNKNIISKRIKKNSSK